ncbi:MAG: GWxTD domain-containing protein [Acidobacteriota bacterium]|nr:GWxTD domain-containing protein [Acidobacteriota bacterium]
MKTKWIGAWIAACLLAASAFAAVEPQIGPASLSKKHKAWIEIDVADIVTSGEREVFLKLASDRDRDLFIEEFWLQRDPTPGTPANEYRTEHFRRLAFADGAFGKKRGTNGRTTPRGRMYIRLGSPIEVRTVDTSGVRPLEVWTYMKNPAVDRDVFRVLFYRPAAAKEYVLYDPAVDKPSRLAKAGGQALEQAAPAPFEADKGWDPAEHAAFRLLCAAAGPEAGECALTCFPGDRGEGAAQRSSAALGALAESSGRRIDDGYAARWLEGKALAEVGYSVRQVAGRAVFQAYFQPDGSCSLHIAAAPERVAFEAFGDDYTAGLRTTIRLEDEGGRMIFERRRDVPISLNRGEMRLAGDKAIRFYDAVPVRPGTMVVRYRIENLIDKEFTVFEKTLTIPEPGTPALTPPLIGRRGVRVAAEAGLDQRAFRVGDIQIDPAPDGVFGTGEEIWLFVQLRGVSAEMRSAGRLETAVRGSGGEMKTAGVPLAGRPDGNVLEKLPTDGLAAGDYAVEVRLVDAAGKAARTQAGSLSLRGGGVRGAWVVAGTNPPAGDPYYAFALGNQAANRGDAAGALASLAGAWRANEESVEFAVGYAEALLAVNNVGPARDVLRRYDGKPGVDFGYYIDLARAAKGAGQVREAAEAYEKALLYRRNDPGALNPLGDCRLTLGDAAAARKAWTRSLDVNPDQPEIRQKLETLR